MTEFKKGQRVKVEFEGTVGWVQDDEISFVSSHESYHYFPIEAVKVTLTDPKDWPPRAGDLWEAGGREWFVRNLNGGMIIIPEDSRASFVADDFKALNPVLVRRRDQ